MSWKPINFQGLASKEGSHIEELNQYLCEKENQLSHTILHSVHPLPRESLPPVLPFSTLNDIKLSDAIEAFGKSIRQIIQTPRSLVANDDWKLTQHQINAALWDYAEVLESSVTEMFQQLAQMNFEQWHPRLEHSVSEVKDILIERLAELKQNLPKIEELLWKYRIALQQRDGQSTFLLKFLKLWQSMLDRSLFPYVKNTEKLLTTRYQWFVSRFSQFFELKREIEQPLQKFAHFEVLKMLDQSNQESFKKLYQLLRFWELNNKTKALPKRDIIRAIRNAFTPEKVYSLFKEYYLLLNRSLFDESRLFKIDPKENFYGGDEKNKSLNFIKECRAELHNLELTIEKYREFYLLTHPNPYIRSRLGWSEWIVGQEPQITKSMQNLVFECDKLDRSFENLKHSLENGPSETEVDEIHKINNEIQNVIHEMGRPLTSETILRNRAEKLVSLLEDINELGSFEPLAVESIERAIAKALRIDWQYHVLFDLPQFKHIYEIHQGITGPVEDRNHLNRMNKFRELIRQITAWVVNKETQKHVQEIELDMNDIKIYLQDFLASVQRLTPEQFHDKQSLKEKIWDLSRQLVECRYLFSGFFYFLINKGSEGKMIRTQFLFVDQYFETIENRIFDLENSLKDEN